MIPAYYSETIQTFSPELDLSQAVFNQDGLVNDVVLIQDRVFRFAKNETWALELLEQELKILKLLQPCFTLKIPEPVRLTKTCISYAFLPGQAFSLSQYDKLSLRQRADLSKQYARALLELHGVPQERLLAEGIKASDAVRDRETWLNLYADLQQELYPHIMQSQRAYIDDIFTPIVTRDLALSYEPKLIHADLAPYHVLFDPVAKSLTGLIDFGTAGLGDPATDLAVILVNYGKAFSYGLFNHYPELQTYLPRARFWAKTLELQWALQSLRKKEAFWFTAHLGLKPL
ncbi:MAG: phosphotransferase [Trueperaceae bacterium]|nr:phosphotransferase [Trueperaceae bacterium]